MQQGYKRLYRSRGETQLTGLCGGLGIYFGVDPVIVRLLWVGVTLITGVLPGVAAYLLAWLIVPMEPLPAPPVQQPATPPTEQPTS